MEDIKSSHSQAHYTPPDSNTILVILLLIFVFPIGIIIMWVLMKQWPKWMKWVITVPAIIIPIVYGLLFSIILLAVDPAEQLRKSEETKLRSDQIKEAHEQSVKTVTKVPMQSNLPEGWTYQNSSECAVKLPLPPKEEPYYIPWNGSEPAQIDEGGFWRFEESTAYTEDSLFTNSSRVFFANPAALGSGYMAGMVMMQCAENTQNYTSRTLAEAFLKTYNSNSSELEFSGNITGSSIFSEKAFTEVTFSGGMNDGMRSYFLADKGKIYELQVVSMSTTPIVQTTTTRISNLIKFE